MTVLATTAIATTATTVAILAQAAAPATETEKWIGPILTSLANVVATYLAFMSSRDRLRYDAASQITANRLKDVEVEVDDCKKDRKFLRRRLNRVIANLQAQMLNRPLPFPNELGFSEDDSQEPPKAP